MAMEPNPPFKEVGLKSLMLLWREVLKELGTWCCTSTDRDDETASVRFENEGIAFLAITLPEFAKDLEKALERGQVDRTLWTKFKFRKGLPQFLGGFLDLIFDRCTGMLLDDPSVDAIFSIRQICLLMSKIELETSIRREELAMQGFVECEQEVRKFSNNLSNESSVLEGFTRKSREIWETVLRPLETDVYRGELLPKHGPGATADRLLGNEKYGQFSWTQRLQAEFPVWEFCIANWSHSDVLDDVELLEPEAEIPVRVISVPKTVKTPRIIAIEPTCMQYVQQAISSRLVEYLEEDSYLSDLIGFTDQLPNREMAMRGSSDGTLATLDLSEASDRVSNLLVETMLARFPNVAKGVQACRSTSADVKGHGIIPLAKYASMGSGLCFPIEAMVFLTIVLMAISVDLNVPITTDLLKQLRGRVRVYGDDIIVPVEHVRSVIASLEAFGLKVNVNKSFWNGKFRESCGGDYYDGQDVSIVKVRRVFPQSRKDAAELVSLVETRNLFYKRGMWATAAHLDGLISKIIPFPCVLDESVILGRFSFLGWQVEAADEHTHAPLVRGAVLRAPLPVNPAEEHAAMIKVLLLLAWRSDSEQARRGRFSDPVNSGRTSERDTSWINSPTSGTESHLERSGRPRSASIKIAWAMPF